LKSCVHELGKSQKVELRKTRLKFQSFKCTFYSFLPTYPHKNYTTRCVSVSALTY